MIPFRVFLIGLVLGMPPVARACTTFCLVDSQRIVFGRNFDYYAVDGRMIVNRRGLQKTAFWTNSGFRWVSRFGSVTSNQFGCEMPNGGINEAGLVVEHMWLDGTVFANDARPSLTELQWIQYQLDCSATVAEVLASDQRIRIQTDSSPLHILVADRGGRSAVIEFLNGRMVSYTDDALPVAALTNHTYAASLAYAGTTSAAQADHVSSLGRFVQAAESVRTFGSAHPADAVAYAFAALANVSQPNWTRWSLVYDIGELSVYFRTSAAPAIKQIRLSDVDFSPGAATRQMDINHQAAGVVIPTDLYSAADNLAVLRSVYRQTLPISWVSLSYLQTRAAYPDSVVRAALPAVTTQPQSRIVGPGDSVDLSVNWTGDASVQWQRNGRSLAGATARTLRIADVQPESSGVYTAVLSNGAGSITSEPAIVGLVTEAKVLGAAREYVADIVHAGSGNTYDQFLLTGSAASITADPGQVARISFVDLGDDIVQVEFAGPGTLTLSLENASGPARPVKFNQDVEYMRGHATVLVAGATASTHVAVFSVGALTNPGVVRAGETYDGHADLATLAIRSDDGRLGSIRCGNAAFNGAAGAIGVLAVGVEVGMLNVHDLCVGGAAVGYLTCGGVPLAQITGGDLYQLNGSSIQCAGLPSQGVRLVAGTSSANMPEPARALRGRLVVGGRDASAELVVRTW